VEMLGQARSSRVSVSLELAEPSSLVLGSLIAPPSLHRPIPPALHSSFLPIAVRSLRSCATQIHHPILETHNLGCTASSVPRLQARRVLWSSAWAAGDSSLSAPSPQPTMANQRLEGLTSFCMPAFYLPSTIFSLV
jgi:hypothetical protein